MNPILPNRVPPFVPFTWLLFTWLLCLTISAQAQGADATPNTTSVPATVEPEATIAAGEDIASLKQLLQQQAGQIEAQQQELSQQLARIEDQGQQIKAQQDNLQTQAQLLAQVQTRLDQVSTQSEEYITEREAALREQLARLQDTVDARFPETLTDLKDVPAGSIPLPGRSAMLKIGGRVNASFVSSLDGIGTTDRFIVGTIPTSSADSPNDDGEFTVSTQSSRLNVDYREQTSFGPMRAYIEGDFAGGSNGSGTFRSRHAFGQFESFLIGKTWSNFVDVRASPESIDFEGLNGQINVRQAQVRYFPRFGQNNKLIFSLEDTEADITDADGISKIPDITAKWERNWFNQWQVQTAVILRQLEGETDTGEDDSGLGFGISWSGSGNIGWFGNERDTLMFQLNTGLGIGRYITDTNTIGGQDGFFDADNDLQILPVWAGYVGAQHWWKDTLRSTFVLGWVDIFNEDDQPDDAYNYTLRTTGNFIWSPVPSVDIGAEFLWGQRTDNNGNTGRATQIQAAARYRF